MTDLYDQRRSLLDEMISRRLLEDEAKSKGKTLEQWFQTDYMNSVPEPSDAEAKAFYEEHKAQIPQGQSFDELKPRIKQAVRQQKLRDNMGKTLEDLKSKHQVVVALEADLRGSRWKRRVPPRPETRPSPSWSSATSSARTAAKGPGDQALMKEYDGRCGWCSNYPLDFHPFAQRQRRQAPTRTSREVRGCTTRCSATRTSSRSTT